MTDITTTVALGASAGAGAVFVAAIGVDPQQLVWGGIGSIIGAGMAGEMGRWRAIAVFVAVVLLSALLGTAAAVHWFGGAVLWRNVCSAVCALFFHPLIAAVVGLLPKVLEAALARVAVQGGAKP